ncbi:hypothetical protein [Bythopirellula goksoeyrii]|uniref:hypothetical protein n=1 Tax=Bythopirellula goksoeyrii TaxID=1400387 RepID=UPI0011CD5DBC|nr:hypothetical protein [Bythopirellula goksoeyrii]
MSDSQRRSQQDKAPRSEIYYPIKRSAEETIDDPECNGPLDAIVTRNHYGSMVLNAYHALFIDVDMPGSSNPSRYGNSSRYGVPHEWQGVFNDLCTVLASERRTGFRVYRTAAGFRVLVTTQEFEPGSACANDLMRSVGADSQFVRFCDTQKTFRARLTPKPWRCGATEPPNQFPRRSAAERRSFSEWLEKYEVACRNLATCQFLKHVGPDETHNRISPIIELHDRATKSHEELQLA